MSISSSLPILIKSHDQPLSSSSEAKPDFSLPILEQSIPEPPPYWGLKPADRLHLKFLSKGMIWNCSGFTLGDHFQVPPLSQLREIVCGGLDRERGSLLHFSDNYFLFPIYVPVVFTFSQLLSSLTLHEKYGNEKDRLQIAGIEFRGESTKKGWLLSPSQIKALFRSLFCDVFEKDELDKIEKTFLENPLNHLIQGNGPIADPFAANFKINEIAIDLEDGDPVKAIESIKNFFFNLLPQEMKLNGACGLETSFEEWIIDDEKQSASVVIEIDHSPIRITCQARIHQKKRSASDDALLRLIFELTDYIYFPDSSYPLHSERIQDLRRVFMNFFLIGKIVWSGVDWLSLNHRLILPNHENVALKALCDQIPEYFSKPEEFYGALPILTKNLAPVLLNLESSEERILYLLRTSQMFQNRFYNEGLDDSWHRELWSGLHAKKIFKYDEETLSSFLSLSAKALTEGKISYSLQSALTAFFFFSKKPGCITYNAGHYAVNPDEPLPLLIKLDPLNQLDLLATHQEDPFVADLLHALQQFIPIEDEEIQIPNLLLSSLQLLSLEPEIFKKELTEKLTPLAGKKAPPILRALALRTLLLLERSPPDDSIEDLPHLLALLGKEEGAFLIQQWKKFANEDLCHLLKSVENESEKWSLTLMQSQNSKFKRMGLSKLDDLRGNDPNIILEAFRLNLEQNNLRQALASIASLDHSSKSHLVSVHSLLVSYLQGYKKNPQSLPLGEAEKLVKLFQFYSPSAKALKLGKSSPLTAHLEKFVAMLLNTASFESLHKNATITLSSYLKNDAKKTFVFSFTSQPEAFVTYREIKNLIATLSLDTKELLTSHSPLRKFFLAEAEKLLQEDQKEASKEILLLLIASTAPKGKLSKEESRFLFRFLHQIAPPPLLDLQTLTLESACTPLFEEREEWIFLSSESPLFSGLSSREWIHYVSSVHLLSPLTYQEDWAFVWKKIREEKKLLNALKNGETDNLPLSLLPLLLDMRATLEESKPFLTSELFFSMLMKSLDSALISKMPLSKKEKIKLNRERELLFRQMPFSFINILSGFNLEQLALLLEGFASLDERCKATPLGLAILQELYYHHDKQAFAARIQSSNCGLQNNLFKLVKRAFTEKVGIEEGIDSIIQKKTLSPTPFNILVESFTEAIRPNLSDPSLLGDLLARVSTKIKEKVTFFSQLIQSGWFNEEQKSELLGICRDILLGNFQVFVYAKAGLFFSREWALVEKSLDSYLIKKDLKRNLNKSDLDLIESFFKTLFKESFYRFNSQEDVELNEEKKFYLASQIYSKLFVTDKKQKEAGQLFPLRALLSTVRLLIEKRDFKTYRIEHRKLFFPINLLELPILNQLEEMTSLEGEFITKLLPQLKTIENEFTTSLLSEVESLTETFFLSLPKDLTALKSVSKKYGSILGALIPNQESLFSPFFEITQSTFKRLGFSKNSSSCQKWIFAGMREVHACEHQLVKFLESYLKEELESYFDRQNDSPEIKKEKFLNIVECLTLYSQFENKDYFAVGTRTIKALDLKKNFFKNQEESLLRLRAIFSLNLNCLKPIDPLYLGTPLDFNPELSEKWIQTTFEWDILSKNNLEFIYNLLVRRSLETPLNDEIRNNYREFLKRAIDSLNDLEELSSFLIRISHFHKKLVDSKDPKIDPFSIREICLLMSDLFFEKVKLNPEGENAKINELEKTALFLNVSLTYINFASLISPFPGRSRVDATNFVDSVDLKKFFPTLIRQIEIIKNYETINKIPFSVEMDLPHMIVSSLVNLQSTLSMWSLPTKKVPQKGKAKKAAQVKPAESPYATIFPEWIRQLQEANLANDLHLSLIVDSFSSLFDQAKTAASSKIPLLDLDSEEFSNVFAKSISFLLEKRAFCHAIKIKAARLGLPSDEQVMIATLQEVIHLLKKINPLEEKTRKLVIPPDSFSCLIVAKGELRKFSEDKKNLLLTFFQTYSDYLYSFVAEHGEGSEAFAQFSLKFKKYKEEFSKFSAMIKLLIPVGKEKKYRPLIERFSAFAVG